MARITVEDCLDKVDNRFELVMVSSKRARQIQIEGKDPMVSVDNDKPTVVALREIADGLVTNEILIEKPSVELGEVEEEMAEAVAEQQDDTPTAEVCPPSATGVETYKPQFLKASTLWPAICLTICRSTRSTASDERTTTPNKLMKGSSAEAANLCAHPLAVAGILVEMHMDHQSLMAAMLHDVIEDTGITKTAIKNQFGNTVADLVDGVSKLNKITFSSRAEAQAENFQKMAMAMAKDLRVILVKIADRLHNMRTLEVLTPDKRRRIARETLDIYAHIATRLGMNNVKSSSRISALLHSIHESAAY